VTKQDLERLDYSNDSELNTMSSVDKLVSLHILSFALTNVTCVSLGK
jgi:hypothetical protein